MRPLRPLTALGRVGFGGYHDLAVVLLCGIAVFAWLSPGDILSSTTPTGGDTAAHVWGPAFLRDELLPSQLRGWSFDWYGGFPAFHFYMVLPFLFMVAADLVLPYGIAFKLVAVSGVVLMPAAAYAMGRLARWSRPVPALLAVAAMLFVFDPSFTILGGNIASTLAGEFAFSIAVSAALVFFGLLWRSLDDGIGRVPAAIALAVVALCHLIVLAFAVLAAVLMVTVRAAPALGRRLGVSQTLAVGILASGILVVTVTLTENFLLRMAVVVVAVAVVLWFDRRSARWALTIGLAGGALSAWWTIPFVLRRSYLNDMGWERVTNYMERLFSPSAEGGMPYEWLLALALLATVVGLIRWHPPTMWLSSIAVSAAALYVLWPQNRLYNARILPFWYLAVHLLAAVGLWLLINAVISLVAGRERAGGAPKLFEQSGRARHWVAPVAALLAVAYVSLYLGGLPGGTRVEEGHFRWGPLTVDSTDINFVNGWAEWNHSGLEEKSAYDEFTELRNATTQLGREHGCGRLLWEYSSDVIGTYGSPMVPMLLPHFTDRCIGSFEGLYFESSHTVAFHFLMQSELSTAPSRPMRDLPYSDLDFNLGVEHMRMSGIRYYGAHTPEAIEAASAAPGLVELAQTSRWVLYEVVDSVVVEPLRYEPSVAEQVPGDERGWVDPAVAWFNDPAAWDVPVADAGPALWQRVVYDDETRSWSIGERRELPPAVVSDVVLEGQQISFSVDEVGVPVLVKVSYFPNWSASGADGPYRVTPNWMVVIPTERDVTLTYGNTYVEWLGWLLTLVGFVTLVVFGFSAPRDVAAGGPVRLARREATLVGREKAAGAAGPAAAGPALSVVVPAYRAADLVSDAVRRIRDATERIGDVEIIVVDDGSSDQTAEMALAAGADQAITHEANRGKGAAVRTGMLAANGAKRVFTDVDLAYDPAQIAQLVEALDAGADVVIGNRTHPRSSDPQARFASRAVGSRLFNAVTRRALVPDVPDTQCGLKGFTGSAAEELFGRSRLDGFAFDVEILWLAQASDMRVADVPVSLERAAASTVSTLRDATLMLRDVLRVRRWVAKGRYE